MEGGGENLEASLIYNKRLPTNPLGMEGGRENLEASLI
jgi:hypothetical protein